MSLAESIAFHVNDPQFFAPDPLYDTCGWCEEVVYWDDTSQIIINLNCPEHGYLIDWEK